MSSEASQEALTVAQEVPPPRQSWLVAHGVLVEPGPRRVLAIASFVNMIGTGMWMAAAALYYTRSVGLSVERVALGMGIGTVVGLLAGIPIGRLADRRGPRGIYVLTLIAQGLAMGAMVLVHSFWWFLLVICLTELVGAASISARSPMVRGLAGPKPALYRAYLRSAVNLAGTIGAVGAGLVVQLNTRHAYQGLVLANALTFWLTALLVLRLPDLPPVPRPAKADGPRNAMHDYPFLVFTALNGLMTFQVGVLSFALPLWIVLHTHAPRWFVGASVLINTILVVLLQVRATRGVRDSMTAAKSWRRSGWAFLAGLVLISLSGGGMPGWAAALLLVAGVGVFTFGEMWQAAGSFELRYALAPAHAQGQYTGVSTIGSSLSGVAAPSVLGLLCITWGEPGWWVLGALLVLVGVAIVPVVSWSIRVHGQSEPE